MIKKIRRKFIFAAMVSIVLVLFIILSIVNIINYNNVNERIDKTLFVLSENGGRFPKAEKNKGEARRRLPPGMSLETPFETRYFSVFFDNNGSVYATDTGFVAAVSEKEAEEYALKAYSRKKETGFINNYKYRVSETESGKMIVFIDCGRELSTFKNFLTISVFVSAIGIILVFILVLILSKIAIKPVIEGYEKQKRFITDASHEIKTPLAIIDANTEVIEMQNGESEWTESTKRQIKRLSKLTSALVALARMDEVSGHIDKAEFSLSETVDDTAKSFAAVAKIQGKEFCMNIEKNITYTGNEELLQRLVSILLDNALKYSNENGQIKIMLKKAGRRCELTVFNTTESILKGNREELFERFYRSDQSRNSETGGYGIGLSMAKSIAEAHRGKISAKSIDGESLIVTVTL